jgi:hypothetical protein
LLLFFYEIYYGRQMVAVAVEPDTTGLGAQRIALILTLLLEEIVATEYLVGEEFQR